MEENMRDWFRLISIGAAVSATLIGCAMQNANVPPAQLMSELQAGQPMLDCRTDCGFAWGDNRQKAAVLDAAGRWQELALLVMQIGYMNDLTYYYLGHAAENLGYLQSAQKYYRIAEKLSVTQMSCHQSEINLENMFGTTENVCAGYVFPDTLYPHLEVVESQLAALSAPSEPTQPHHVKRRVVKRPATPTTASAAGSSQAVGSGFVVPAPTAAPPGGSGFVEPAPAASSSDQFAIPPVRH
jgi:hypothetical protein